MNYSRFIKTRLKQLNNTDQTFVDIFRLIHDDNSNIFCEQINDRVFVQEVSYWEIKRLSINLATHLSAVHRGVRIGLKMRNSYLFIVMFWGIILSGNTPVLINIELTNDQIDKVVKELDIKDVIDYDAAKELNKLISNKLPSPDFDYSNATDEIILMSMGTTGNLHYSLFSGKKVAAFINKTPYIVKRVPKIISSKHIKHIVLLPLYHVFGLFTVYFWFAFFKMPFLFIDNITNDPLGNIRRYKVTHIFGVPAFFNIVAEGIVKEVKNQNMLNEFNEGIERSIAVQTKYPNINRNLIRRKFDAVINKTFGYDIAFLISGGASIDEETLKIFNGIGYDLITGYGATEIGITSINLASKGIDRILPNIGTPLPNVDYQINEEGILEVKADTQADNVTGVFISNDFVEERNNIYNFIARSDELVTLDNGENYNLNYLQSLNYHFETIKQFCFIPNKNNIVFLFSINNMNQEEVILAKNEIRNNDVLKNNKVTKIMFTKSPLRVGLKAINYREVLNSIKLNEIIIEDLALLDDVSNNLITKLDSTALKVEEIIKNVLNITKPIGYNVDIFLELGCTSFDYALIINDVNEQFKLHNGSNINELFPTLLRSVNEFVEFINQFKEQ